MKQRCALPLSEAWHHERGSAISAVVTFSIGTIEAAVDDHAEASCLAT